MSIMWRNRYGFFAIAAVLALSLSACGGAESRKAKHLEKGKVFLAAGNFEKARIEFQNALQIAPLDGEARYENGVVAGKLGKLREAIQFYEGAIDVEPNHLGARQKLAEIYVLAGSTDNALKLIGPGLEQHPEDSELLALRAAARVKNKDVAGAEQDAEHALRSDPKNADAVATLAGILMSEGKNERSMAVLRQGLLDSPDSVDLRLALAQQDAGNGRLAEAETLLVEIVKLKPKEPVARIRLAQFYNHEKQPDAAERVLREGISALPDNRDIKLALIDFLAAQRSVEAAEKEMRAMSAAAPKDVEMQFALARFYERNKQPERAEKIYRAVADNEKLSPAGLAARDRLALLLVSRNAIGEADKLIAEVLDKSPRDDEALTLRGTLALARKDPKDAIADLRSVLRDQPNSLGVLRSLARAHLANGESAIAEETLRRASDMNPKDLGLKLDLAQLLAQTGKLESAKPLLADIIKEQPTNVAALDSLYKVSAALKDFTTARLAADAMVATLPKAGTGYLYQGMLADDAKHPEEALRLYRQAEDLQPDALEPLRADVSLLINAKRAPEALARLDAVASAHPDVALPLNLKGELLLAQNRSADAARAFEAAIARAPKWWLPYRGLSLAQLVEKNPDAALATLHGAPRDVDEPQKIDMEIAALYERTGKIDDAIRAYDALVKRNPEWDLPANNLAMLLATYKSDASDLDRAKTLTSRFANSSNPSFLDTYGWVLFKHGEASASVPLLEKAAQGDNHPVVLYHLGMAQSKTGNDAEARENLGRAVSSGVNFAGIDEARATLERLPKPSANAAPKS
jgi:tetratricopeptide (TPR) repeat protein